MIPQELQRQLNSAELGTELYRAMPDAIAIIDRSRLDYSGIPGYNNREYFAYLCKQNARALPNASIDSYSFLEYCAQKPLTEKAVGYFSQLLTAGMQPLTKEELFTWYRDKNLCTKDNWQSMSNSFAAAVMLTAPKTDNDIDNLVNDLLQVKLKTEMDQGKITPDVIEQFKTTVRVTLKRELSETSTNLIHMQLESVRDKLGTRLAEQSTSEKSKAGLTILRGGLLAAEGTLKEKIGEAYQGKLEEVDAKIKQAQKEFKSECKGYVDTAKKEADADLSWRDFFNNILKEAYNAVVVPMVNAMNKISGSEVKASLFKIKHSATYDEIENAEQDVNKGMGNS